MSQWKYNGTSGAYQLATKNGFLDVNTRFGHVAVVYSGEQDGHTWTYSINSHGGRRWRPTKEAMEFKDISMDDARVKLREYEDTFKTPGLPKEGKNLVATVLRMLESANPPKPV